MTIFFFFIKALDLIAAVKGLHELSPQQLGKLIRDSGNNVVRHIAEDGSHIQVIRNKQKAILLLGIGIAL